MIDLTKTPKSQGYVFPSEWEEHEATWLSWPHKEEVVVTELDLSQTDYFRKHWPFLRDRRIDSYQPIVKRFIDEE